MFRWLCCIENVFLTLYFIGLISAIYMDRHKEVIITIIYSQFGIRFSIDLSCGNL